MKRNNLINALKKHYEDYPFWEIEDYFEALKYMTLSELKAEYDYLVVMDNLTEEQREKCIKFYIHVYDYEKGQAILETDFYNSIEKALKHAKKMTVYTTEDINIELMFAIFDEVGNLEEVAFGRNLEENEYIKGVLK